MPRPSRRARRASQLSSEAPAAPALTVVPDPVIQPIVETVAPVSNEDGTIFDGSRFGTEVIVNGSRVFQPISVNYSTSTTSSSSLLLNAYMTIDGRQLPTDEFIHISRQNDLVDASTFGGGWHVLPGITNQTVTITTSGANTVGYDYVYPNGGLQISPPVLRPGEMTAREFNDMQFQLGRQDEPTQPTPEQRAEAAARHAAANVRRQADEIARTAARTRARDSLFMFLSAEQQADYTRTGKFSVIGSHGNHYRIGPGSAGNVEYLEGGEVVGRLCAHPTMRHGWLPDQDVALSQMMALMTDEQNFCRIANVHRGRRPEFNTPRHELAQRVRNLIAA